VCNAAPFAGGVLAKGSASVKRITYQFADDAALAPVRQVEDTCARHGVAPGTVAFQFSTNEPRVTSTIIGVSRPSRVQQALDWAEARIDAAVWNDLATLKPDLQDPEANRAYVPG
jgi:D-threo-aldose 1-dehydrogenase